MMWLNMIIVVCCAVVAGHEASVDHGPLALGYAGLAIAYLGFAWSFAQ